MGSRLRRLAWGALLWAVRLPEAHAEAGVQLAVDNDYLNLWQSPQLREDRDYTHGLEFSLNTARIPGFAAWLARAPGTRALDPNACFEMSIRQQIYTPDWEGTRPNAGWLGIAARVRRESGFALREIGAEVGVTGPPSLAEPAQKWFHRQFGFVPPPGWESQVPFEPALNLDARWGRQLVSSGTDGGWQLRGGPLWGGQLGTRLTGASGGFATTLGLRPPAPWKGSTRAASGFSAFAIAGARLDLVAWDATLDGTLFHSSPSVSKYPGVIEVEAGLGAGHGRARLEWRVVRRTTEYRTEPGPHTYSTLALSVAGR